MQLVNELLKTQDISSYDRKKLWKIWDELSRMDQNSLLRKGINPKKFVQLQNKIAKMLLK